MLLKIFLKKQTIIINSHQNKGKFLFIKEFNEGKENLNMINNFCRRTKLEITMIIILKKIVRRKTMDMLL